MAPPIAFAGLHRASLRRSATLALSLVLVALLLCVAVQASGGVAQGDRALAAAAWRLRQPWLDEAMIVLSGLGDGLPRWCVTLVVSVYLATTRRYRWALALVVAMMASAALAPALKLIFHTARPSPLYAVPEAFSFPSGHAMAVAALYGVLEFQSSRRLAQSARASFQQLRAQTRLERGDLLADRRLAQPKDLGGLGEATKVDNANEQLQGRKTVHSSLIHAMPDRRHCPFNRTLVDGGVDG
jgi:hypothetical protein